HGASILVTGKNFGCGSSREHAPWALADYGFHAIIAPSFADIFANNCTKNRLLPITLREAEVTELLQRASNQQIYRLTVDLERKIVTDNAGFSATFEIDDFRRNSLLNGLDDIDLSLQHEAEISKYEAQRPEWLQISRA
ncbi:MAG: 3-isopropylmalate dehydratase small subunit, partial [Pyrinomonadaceae bacterium]